MKGSARSMNSLAFFQMKMTISELQSLKFLRGSGMRMPSYHSMGYVAQLPSIGPYCGTGATCLIKVNFRSNARN